MEDLDIHFCNECFERISCDLSQRFWKRLCAQSIAIGPWVPFIDNKKMLSNLLRELEKKRFLVSTDHKDRIYIQPKGVYSLSQDDGYLVCLNPNIHLSEE